MLRRELIWHNQIQHVVNRSGLVGVDAGSAAMGVNNALFRNVNYLIHDLMTNTLRFT